MFVLQSAADEESFGTVLRQTARIGLFIYLLIFMLRPAQQLRPSKTGRALLRNRRYIGVAFAGVMTAHLMLIIWFWFFVLGEAIPALLLVSGGGAYLMIFLMLITSFDKPARALGPRSWRRLHKLGLYWIGAVFANTIAPDVLREPRNPFYLATVLLMLVAIVLRVLAYLKRQSRSIPTP
jgi:hypothetical protein